MAVYSADALLQNDVSMAFDEAINYLDSLSGETVSLSEFKFLSDALIALINTIQAANKKHFEKVYNEAKEAENYVNHATNFITGTKAKGRFNVPNDFTQVTIVCGNTTYTQITYYKALFCHTIYTFDDVKKWIALGGVAKAKEEIKKITKTDEYKHSLMGVTYTEQSAKADPESVLKKLSNTIKEFQGIIEYSKKWCDSLEKDLVDMKNNLKEMKNDKNEDKDVVKYCSKILKIMKTYYSHNMALLNQTCKVILKNSKYCAKFIEKYSEKE